MRVIKYLFTCPSDNYLFHENSVLKYLFQILQPPLPPWRLNGGPLMTNHIMSSLAIMRAHKVTM